MLFVITSSCSLSFFFFSLCICGSCASLSLFLPVMTGVAHAVEIKVIKDLPWPPPVGQLNSTPPVVEELESPSQAAQPQQGQTSCDQHHHGGCCAHILLYGIHLPVNPPHLPHCQSFNQSPIIHAFLWYDMSVRVCTTPVLCLIILLICISNTFTSVHTYTVVITEDLPKTCVL